jgi:pimeloyl-ACP methyl ester carboxylesterase
MLDATDLSCQPARASTSNDCADRVDFVEAGAGPLVVLVHSSMAGARQWSALIRDLEDRLLVRAVNLFGYGNTPTWSKATPPSLDDYAELVAQAVPCSAGDISLVGHSFGGAVAMQAAARQLKGRVKRLVLIEPSPFYLLDSANRREAYYEISILAKYTRRCIWAKEPEAAAERFIDYWCGPGTWAASSPDKKASFVRSIGLLAHEWGAVLRGKTTPEEWTAALPQDTLVMSSATTVRPSRELVDVLSRARPAWAFATVRDGGHMAPLTHPHLVNPIISGFLG